jgi:hypothetical protein
MKWKNALLDKPPQSGQTVLISVDGVYYITDYDLQKSVYRLRKKPDIFFDPKKYKIYWTELTNPKD